MSIFNSFAALASGGEVETGTVYPTSSSATNIAITFQNSHTTRPFAVVASCEYISTSYTCFCAIIDYSQDGFTPESSRPYGMQYTVRGTTTPKIYSYTSSTISNVLTTTGATLTRYSSSYGFPSSGYKWKWTAIWL